MRAGSQNGSADLENSVLAHAGGPSSASQSQAAPATPSNVANLLREILWRHAGSFACQDIPDELKYVGPGEETAYSQLNQMYEEGELREFVEAHCEFFECERVGTSMSYVAPATPPMSLRLATSLASPAPGLFGLTATRTFCE